MSQVSSADFQSASEPLPPGWTNTKLGDLDLGRTEGIEPAEEPDTLFELWSVPSFPNGQPERVLGSTIGSNKQRVAEGDVLLCKINPRINRVWRVGPESGLPQIASTEWIVFRSPAFDPAFLMWRFRENRFRAALCANMTGVGGSLTRARPKDVAQIEIALPPLPEQRRIVARLEALEARSRRARSKLAEVPAQLAQARQSLLAAAFQGDLTADWREANGSTALWSKSDLATVLTSMRNGISVKPDAKAGLPILRISAVRPLLLDLTDRRFLPSDFPGSGDYGLAEGDLLFTRYNGNAELVGACAVVPRINERVVYPDKLIRVRVDPKVAIPHFIAAAMSCGISRQHIADCAKTAAGQVGISGKDLKQTPIPLPPLPEQHEIVRRLSTAFARLDAAASAHAATVAGLDRLDQSLLARAFSGGLVPQSAAVATAVSVVPPSRSALKPKSYLTQLVPALLRVHDHSLALDQINSALALLHSPRAARDRVFRELGALEALEYFTTWSQAHEDGALTAAINDLLKIGTLSQKKDRKGHITLHLVGKLPPILPEVEADARHLATFIEHVPALAPGVAPAVPDRVPASIPRARGHARLKNQIPV